MRLLVATNNAGKLREIRQILAGTGVEVVGISDVAPGFTVDEDGETFLENAMKKARALNEATGLPTLADDSGLAVEALGGRPGVRSARYAGDSATDEENYLKLLAEIKGVADGERGASFICAMALIAPEGAVYTSTGELKGSIAHAPRGGGGFGYDPVFLLGDGETTLAEASAELKNAISHRAKALAAMFPNIRRVAG